MTKILVIDDEKISREKLRSSLEKEGFTGLAAEDG